MLVFNRVVPTLSSVCASCLPPLPPLPPNLTLQVLDEAGCALVGGHTCEGEETSLGE